mmetsp:Transcript_23184/g.35286  ORF Transcript_23184/g.35286 Transcript_23184/m.35286 type:complete len:156 (-) Transcript_23184:8-475(-)
MFHIFATGVFCLQGAMLSMASMSMLLDYKAAVEGSTVQVDEFEAITSGSNAGAYCAVTKIEHALLLLVGVSLLSLGIYVPLETKGVPALGVGLASFVLAHSERMIATDGLPIRVYQGEFTELIGPISLVNAFFGVLYSLVALGSFLGYGKKPKGE